MTEKEKERKEKYWITYIKRRIKKNKNFLGFISGQTGSGKSYCSLRIAQDIDPDFSIDHVVFRSTELMDLINSGRLKSGAVIIFEEMGVDANNKNWQSTTNKMLNYLMQTFRHKNYIMIMNSPMMDFVDAGLRKLFHAELQTIGIDLSKNEVKLKPHLLQYNPRNKKWYYKRLKVTTNQGKFPISVWRVGKPSKPLLKDYEAKKRVYTDALNKQISDELQQANKKGKPKLTQVQEDTIQKLKDKMIPKDIALEQGRSVKAVYETIKQTKKKGVKITAKFNHKFGGSKVEYYDVIDLPVQ